MAVDMNARVNDDVARLALHRERERHFRQVLKEKVGECAVNERDFAAWERRVADTQVQIEENIVHCDEMLREADAKRSRAQRTAMDDLNTQRMKSRDISALLERITDIRAKCKTAERKIKANERYFQYLYRASQSMGTKEFGARAPTTEDVYELVEETLDRHRTLLAANTQLQELIVSTVGARDEVTQVHSKCVAASRETILALHTRLGEMKRKLETLTRETTSSATMVEHFEKKSLSRHASVSLVKLSTENLYAACVKRSNVSRCPTNEARGAPDTIARLNVIRHYMGDIRGIVDTQP
jgi:hypothetical protein